MFINRYDMRGDSAGGSDTPQILQTLTLIIWLSRAP